MDEDNHTRQLQPLYLFKVLLGLTFLSTLIFTALLLPQARLSPTQHQLGLGILLILALALIPYVQAVYRRRDELQQLLHMRASMQTLALLTTVSCLLGILQASDIIPLFNQFWTLGLLIAVWGLNLMLADRHYK
jgi:hypothetical protein